MILLKISNSSEIIASKLGKFLESLTPDALDERKVEDVVVRTLCQKLSEEGLKGEIAVVQGLDLGGQSDLVIKERLHVRHQQRF
ncbi:MAG: hypothetical protein VKO00_07070 [Cyanobacteriota bacterium]|jgi:hypothetical protein|nr:hypothetical protein [Cyanobacteriota bacterium]